MDEIVVKIEGIDYRDFYGPKNMFIDRIALKFPQLRISSRGAVVRAWGEESELAAFRGKLERLIAYVAKYGHISFEVVDQVFDTFAVMPPPVADPAAKETTSDILLYGNNGLVVKARSVNQQRIVDALPANDLIFAIGPAGTGKTYTAIALAVRSLKNRETKKIILTRPAVEAGERLGFLPGDMKNKLDPYLQPLYDALHDMLPAKKLEEYIETSVVQIAPLAYMRGRTLDNAFVILDEAQNATLSQIKMFLTRMGKNAKFIVTGDVTQIDLPKKSDSGLLRCTDMLERIEGISVIKMQETDIVRHKLVKEIVKAFENVD